MTFNVQLASVAAAIPPPPAAGQWFAATSGTAGGAGTIGSPWDLQTALNGGPSGQVQPGDTVNLRSGTYVGRFTCRLVGSADKRITLTFYPADGNWWNFPAKIDNGGGALQTTLAVNSQYVDYKWLEVFCSVGKRKSSQDGSSPTDLNSGSGMGSSSGGGLYVGNRLIECNVHDVTDGIGIFTEGVDLVVDWMHVSNIGWDGATDRGHGHAVYMQNDAIANPGSTRTMRGNIFVNANDDLHNIHGASARCDNMISSQNISYHGGGISSLSPARPLNVDGGPHSTSPGMSFSMDQSIYYQPDFEPATSTPNYFLATVGFDQAPFASLTITNSFFLAFACVVGAQFSGVFNGPNTITGNVFLKHIGTDNATITEANFPGNTYLGAKPGANVTRLFVSPYHTAGAAGARGHLAIMNWLASATVAVDISSVVASGHTYEIRNAENYFGTPVLSGTYAGGTVNVPMNALSCATPLGTAVPKTATTCGPEFGAFIVVQTN